MRRLPIYFLIDVSESMVGEPLEQVHEGISSIIKELRTDPYSLETVYISIIAFAGKPKRITPLVELFNFYPPKLPIGGGTCLGEAINYLIEEIENSVQKTTLEVKGDWKPIVFLFTDGNPTDDYKPAFTRWNSKYRKSINLVVISIGNNTNLNIFSQITENVLILKDTSSDSFKKFFKWVTASIKSSSLSISNSNKDDLTLAPITNGYLSKIDLNKEYDEVIDENFAVFLAKCQNTKRLYLIKYQKRLHESSLKEVNYRIQDYKLIGAFPIENDYFEMAEQKQRKNMINTNDLVGFPNCPCCGNQHGFSICSCGNLLCIGDEEISTCPWCGIKDRWGFGEGGFDVTRTRG